MKYLNSIVSMIMLHWSIVVAAKPIDPPASPLPGAPVPFVTTPLAFVTVTGTAAIIPSCTSSYPHYTFASVTPSPIPTTTTSTAEECPTIFYRPPPFEDGPIKTDYASTITSTNLLDCGGCSTLIIVDPFGLWTETPFTTTTAVRDVRTIVTDQCYTSTTSLPPVASYPAGRPA